MDKAQELLIYQPKTKAGKELTETSTYPFEVLHEGGKYVGDKVLKTTDSPTAAAIVSTAVEALPILFAGKVIKAVKNSKLYRKATIKERGLIVQSLEQTLKKNPKMSEAELVKKSDMYFKEAMDKRKLEEKVETKTKSKIKPKNEEVFDVDKIKEQPKKKTLKTKIKPLKDKDQQNFVDKKVEELGSLKAVENFYSRPNNVSNYARQKAVEVYGGEFKPLEVEKDVKVSKDPFVIVGKGIDVKTGKIIPYEKEWQAKKGMKIAAQKAGLDVTGYKVFEQGDGWVYKRERSKWDGEKEFPEKKKEKEFITYRFGKPKGFAGTFYGNKIAATVKQANGTDKITVKYLPMSGKGVLTVKSENDGAMRDAPLANLVDENKVILDKDLQNLRAQAKDENDTYLVDSITALQLKRDGVDILHIKDYDTDGIVSIDLRNHTEKEILNSLIKKFPDVNLTKAEHKKLLLQNIKSKTTSNLIGKPGFKKGVIVPWKIESFAQKAAGKVGKNWEVVGSKEKGFLIQEKSKIDEVSEKKEEIAEIKSADTNTPFKNAEGNTITKTKPILETLTKPILNEKGNVDFSSVQELGEKLYIGGKQKYFDWQKKMKSALGDLWGKVKKYIQEIWKNLRKPVNNQRGSVTIRKGKKLDPVAITAGIKKSGKELWSGTEPTRKKLKLTSSELQKLLLDPRNVTRKDKYAYKSFKALAAAEENKNAFIDRNYKKYLKATKNIEKGSISSEKIGKALDGQFDVNKLTKIEKKAYDFFKENYEAQIVEYAKRAAGSEEAYQKILYLVSRKLPKKSKVSELSADKLADYNTVTEELLALKAGRKLNDLSSEERRTYASLKQMKTDLLVDNWRKRLPPNEAEAYDILSRKINDYLPHMFDRVELLDNFKLELIEVQEKLSTATNKSVITKYKKRITLLKNAISRIEGGKLVTFDQLPSSVFFQFFNPRTGKKGYSFDALKAYEAYLFGMGRKMFDEPAIKLIKSNYFDKIQPGMKRYTESLVKRYMGYDSNAFDWFAGVITSLQWMRTLGLNPRSALVNLGQRVNTIAEIGEKYSLKSEGMILFESKKANEIFDRSGIAREVPDVLTEGDMSKGLERMRTLVGFMFNQIELGNRKHAYLAGYIKAMDQGKSREQARKEGIRLVHKTQFRYGKLGMPKLFWNPIARVSFQFSSYTLKQAQFLYKLLKTNPFKFMKWIAYTTGIDYLLREFFDSDMSNAFGIGITWGEAFQAIKAFVEGDRKAAYRHSKQTITPGTGILPSGPGPTITSGVKIVEGIEKGEGKKQIVKEITPVIVARLKQAYDAVKTKRDDEKLYTIRSGKGNAIYKLNKRQLIQRTFGPKTAKEGIISKNYMKARNLEIERRQGIQSVIDAIIEGDEKKIKKAVIANKEAVMLMLSQKGLLDRMVETELLNRTFTKEERKTLGTKTKYQLLREGETY